jgi:hypothetical protein
MISLFANDYEFETVASQTFTAAYDEPKEANDSPAIIRRASNAYGQSNRFYRQARQIYERAVVTERMSQQQTA